MPFTAFTRRNLGALDEAAHLLWPGGRLVIETGRIAPVNEIVAGLRAAGFHSVRVARRGLARAATLRIEAVLGGPSP